MLILFLYKYTRLWLGGKVFLIYLQDIQHRTNSHLVLRKEVI